METDRKASPEATTHNPLRQAVLALDRARCVLAPGSADGVVELGRALLDGCWSLVDHFDHEGRRHLIVRKNDLGVSARPGLSQRERQVVSYASLGHSNKLIAFELQLGCSTVATHLRAALEKLGLSSRQTLISYWCVFSDGQVDATLNRFDFGCGEHAVMSLPTSPLPAGLTLAEREVVAAVLAGGSNKLIARARRISVRTVANELASIYRKLGVGSRAALAARFANCCRR